MASLFWHDAHLKLVARQGKIINIIVFAESYLLMQFHVSLFHMPTTPCTDENCTLVVITW